MPAWLAPLGAALGLGAAGTAGSVYYRWLTEWEDPKQLGLDGYSRVTRLSQDVTLADQLRSCGAEVSDDDLRSFKESGYLIVRGVLPADYVRMLDGEANRYFEEYKGTQAFFRPWSKRNAIHGIGHIAGWARDLQKNMTAVGELAARLLGTGEEPMLLVHDALDCISPSQGSAGTAPFRRVRAIRAWIPLQDIPDDKTGCTVVVPGSHRWDNDCTMGHYTDTTKPLCPSYHDLYVDDWGNGYYEPWTGSDLKRGDVVFLHPNVLHGWGPNESGKRRLALRATLTPKSWGWKQPLPFHGQGPPRLVAPEIYPNNGPAQSDEGWPLPELSFMQFAEFSVGVLARSVRWKLAGTRDKYLKPEA